MTGLACWRPESSSSFELNSVSLAPSIVRTCQRRSSQLHNSVVQARAALLGTHWQGRRAGRQQEAQREGTGARGERARLGSNWQGRRAGRQQEAQREGPGGQPGALALGQARGASAHAKNGSCARRDRGARVASRKQLGRDVACRRRRTRSRREKRGSGTRRVEQRSRRRVRFSEDCSGGGRLKKR
jgi:hypothetical protein